MTTDMKILLLPAALVAFLASCYAGPADRVFCYFDSRALSREGSNKISFLDLESSYAYCTHLVYGYATIDTDTYKVKPLNDKEDHNRYTSILAIKKKIPTLKVLLSVGGGISDSDKREKYFELLEKDDHRSDFVSSAKSLIKQHGFDGLDLAWEFPINKAKKDRGTLGSIWHSIKKTFGYAHSHKDEKADEHREQFSALVRELKTATKNDNLIITLSIIPGINHTIYYDAKALTPHIDYLNIMAFDFYTATTNSPKEADYPAPLYAASQRAPEATVDGNVRHYLEQGIPAAKLIVGIPTFSRTWKLTEESGLTGTPPLAADGPGEEGGLTHTPGLLSYTEVCTLLPNPNNSGLKSQLKRVNDPSRRLGSYGYRLPADDVSGIWVGYEDPDTAGDKASYVKSKGLAGIAVVDISLDDYSGICTGDKFPILKSARNHLL